MLRRFMLIGAFPLLLLGGCAQGTQSATTLAMAKQWIAGVSGALVAASQAYTGPRSAEVRQYAVQLQQAAADFQGMGDVTNARAAATSVLQVAQQLLPLLVDPAGRPLLGTNAGYVAMGLAVAQAFIAALPPPPQTPPEPPAALVRAASVR